MHGRKRSEYKALQRDSKVSASLAAKAVAWHQLMDTLLARRRDLREEDSSSSTTTTLPLLEKALTVNPDPIWLWNFRRQVLEKDKGQVDEDEWWNREANLTQAALQSNPKAYAAWHHRKWCLMQVCSERKETTDSLLQQELALTVLFLKRDERNFHCWSYRRFAVSCLLAIATPGSTDGSWRIFPDDKTPWMGAQIAHVTQIQEQIPSSDTAREVLQVEWDFTTEKIQENFSNFSAFHYRSQLLEPLLKLSNGGGPFSSLEQVITEEFELISNAIFTEPEDQTAWWYQRFLLDFMQQQQQQQRADEASPSLWYCDTLLPSHLELLHELKEEVSIESQKWVLLGLLQVLERTITKEDTKAERRSILEQLLSLDPDRKQRYRHLLSNLEKESG